MSGFGWLVVEELELDDGWLLEEVVVSVLLVEPLAEPETEPLAEPLALMSELDELLVLLGVVEDVDDD